MHVETQICVRTLIKNILIKIRTLKFLCCTIYFTVSRRIGKVTMIVEKIDLQDVKEESAQTVIKSEDEDEEEDMEGPALKKPKQEL